MFDLKDEPTVNKFRQFLGATSIWNSKADFTQLHGKVLKSAQFALENTPSEFLTDSNYQQKFQNLFMSMSPRALFREIMSTYLILGFYSKTSTEFGPIIDFRSFTKRYAYIVPTNTLSNHLKRRSRSMQEPTKT